MPVRRSEEKPGWEVVWQASFNLLRYNVHVERSGNLRPTSGRLEKKLRSKSAGSLQVDYTEGVQERFASVLGRISCGQLSAPRSSDIASPLSKHDREGPSFASTKRWAVL
jgi:hypothetical protein